MLFLYSLLIISCFLTIAYFLGAVVFSLCGKSDNVKFVDFYYRLFVGFVLLVLAFAVIKSLAHTTLLLLLIPAFIFWYKKKSKRGNSIFYNLLPSTQWVLITFSIVAILVYFMHHFFESVTMQQDAANYLKMSEAMQLTGQENTRHFRNVFSDSFQGIEPYHYFEMWLGALFMNISFGTISHLECFRVCAYVSILTMSVLGLIAICETIHRRVTFIHIITSLLFLFFIPNVVQLFFDYEHHFNYGIECNPINRLNFRTYWMFLMPAFILIIQKEYFLSFIALLLLPAVSITTTPAVFGALGMLFLANRWTKYLNKKEMRLLLLTVLSYVVGLLFLISAFKMKKVPALYSFTPDYIIGYFKNSWKAVTYYIGIEFVNVLVVFSPFLLLLVALRGRKTEAKQFINENKVMLSIAFAFIVSGIVFFQMASFMNNAYQFVFISFCVFAISCFVLFQKRIEGYENESSMVMASLFLCVFLLFSAVRLTGISRKSLFVGQELYSKSYKTYSYDYLKEMESELLKLNDRPGAYIGDSSYYEKMYYSKRLPDFYFPGSCYHIFSIVDNSYQLCLSDTNAIVYGYNGTQRDLTFLHQSIAASLFHREFYQEIAKSVGEKRSEAIEKFKIAYLILTPNVLVDKEWSDKIRKTILDENTGEKLILMK